MGRLVEQFLMIDWKSNATSVAVSWANGQLKRFWTTFPDWLFLVVLLLGGIHAA